MKKSKKKYSKKDKQIRSLKREWSLNYLKINKFLSVTQAINAGAQEEELYEIYKSFLYHELNIKKMALYTSSLDGWNCVSSINVPEHLLLLDISNELDEINDEDNSKEFSNSPVIGEFDVVIPVQHHDRILSYCLIGNFADDGDMYDKVQFITALLNTIMVAVEKNAINRQKEAIEREIIKKRNNVKLAYIKLDGYYELQSSILQFWTFFDEYLRKTKGIEIKFIAKRNHKGIELNIEENNYIDDDTLNKYFLEYSSLLFDNDIQLQDKYTIDALTSEIIKLEETLTLQRDFLAKNLQLTNKLISNSKINNLKPKLIPNILTLQKDKIKYYIANNKLNEAILELYNNVRYQSIENDVILLKSNLKRINDLERQSLISFDTANIEYAKIKKSILDLVEEI